MKEAERALVVGACTGVIIYAIEHMLYRASVRKECVAFITMALEGFAELSIAEHKQLHAISFVLGKIVSHVTEIVTKSKVAPIVTQLGVTAAVQQDIGEVVNSGAFIIGNQFGMFAGRIGLAGVVAMGSRRTTECRTSEWMLCMVRKEDTDRASLLIIELCGSRNSKIFIGDCLDLYTDHPVHREALRVSWRRDSDGFDRLVFIPLTESNLDPMCAIYNQYQSWAIQKVDAERLSLYLYDMAGRFLAPKTSMMCVDKPSYFHSIQGCQDVIRQVFEGRLTMSSDWQDIRGIRRLTEYPLRHSQSVEQESAFGYGGFSPRGIF